MKKRRITALLTAMAVLTMGVAGCGSMAAAPAASPNAAAPTETAAESNYDEAPYEEEYYDEYDNGTQAYTEETGETYADEAEEIEAYAEEEAGTADSAEMYDYAAPAAENSYLTVQGAESYKSSGSASREAEKEEEGSYYDEVYGNSDKRAEKEGRGRNVNGRNYLGQIYDYDCFPAGFDSEEYSELEEQGYRSVLYHPLSTFAADVDTASYSNLRRMISDGCSAYNLPKGSVRVEELINYFDYDYRGPEGSDPFGVNIEAVNCPWNEDAMLMSVGLKTEDIDYSDTPASNLVFLIDVSGSMSSRDKLPLLQDAFSMLVDELSDKDRVSIVTYASGVRTVLDGAHGDDKRKIKHAINKLSASGGTNGGAGIELAYKLADKSFIKGGNNRVILATDGDLNIGPSSVEELEELISEKKETGVYLSVLGFGTGNIKDNKMETLADKGNGNYSYIDSEREARKVLVDELSANMLTVCKDVKLQVEFNPAVVKGYRLVGYANRVMKDKDFNDDKKDGGEIGAGHEVTVLYEIIPTEEYMMAYDDDVDVDSLRYSDEYKKAAGSKYRSEDRATGNSYGNSERSYMGNIRNTELMTLSVRYKKPAEDKSNLLTYPITFASYTDDPSDDMIFKCAVAEFGLIASDSEYKGDSDMNRVLDELDSIRLNDEYRREFRELVEMAR